MGFGKMNTRIEIISTEPVKDAEGFINQGDNVLVSVRAYKEERHGNEAWKNRASFSTASALFRFRIIPGVQIKTDMVISCESERFNIVSVEDVKDRGMYLEVLCEKVIPSG